VIKKWFDFGLQSTSFYLCSMCSLDFMFPSRTITTPLLKLYKVRVKISSMGIRYQRLNVQGIPLQPSLSGKAVHTAPSTYLHMETVQDPESWHWSSVNYLLRERHWSQELPFEIGTSKIKDPVCRSDSHFFRLMHQIRKVHDIYLPGSLSNLWVSWIIKKR
jgi:hypothetical protein